jgi:ornithine cyclodeaminase
VIDLLGKTHGLSAVDLVGRHSPATRERDDDGVRRASVFVDFCSSAMAEAGDILIPLRSGVNSREHILGDLYDLLNGSMHGRSAANGITLFKSVCNGLEDLAAAESAFRGFRATQR